MEKYHVLVVEDDKEIRDGIEIYLKSQGYEVFKAADGIEGLEIIYREEIHLAIVDVMMPGLDGIRTTLKVRETSSIPIIILSAKSEDADKILGLNIGADDYVTKPFSPKELVARVKAITKRRDNNPKRLVFGGLEEDDVAHEVKIDGNLINLTPKEYDLLKYFVSNNHIALSREQLLTNIWGYDFYGDDRTVDTHVKTLRHQLGSYGSCIKTIRKVGYKFEY